MLDTLHQMVERKHEELIFHCHPALGLRGIIALHDTTRGPALGGVRLFPYQSNEDAIKDALRLAEAMTYKAIIAGVPYGGGKAVIIANGTEQDPHIRTALFQAFGHWVDHLGGRYIAAEDIGTRPEDMVQIRKVTSYVVGLPSEEGGSGDPCPVTAFGVMQGMKALVEEVLGTDRFANIRIAIQGLGGVGMNLAELLISEGAIVIGSDIRPEVIHEARSKLNIEMVPPDTIYDVPCDIFSPCAMGSVINDRTIPRLSCKIVAGSANNQLDSERHGEELHARGIVYAVDYVINAGGLINVAQEIEGFDAVKVHQKTAQIYSTAKRLLAIARGGGISTQRAAHCMALNLLKDEDK